MGLGKTLQALCAVRGRSLVVAPTSVLHNWEVLVKVIDDMRLPRESCFLVLVNGVFVPPGERVV